MGLIKYALALFLIEGAALLIGVKLQLSQPSIWVLLILIGLIAWIRLQPDHFTIE